MKPKNARTVSAKPSKSTLKVAKRHAAKKVSRPSRKRKTEELALHMNCVQWFKKTFPEALAFHVPNGETAHGWAAGDKLKRMGVLAGVPDWLVFPSIAKVVAIEFKTEDGDQNGDQLDFEVKWRALDLQYYIARSLQDFQEICNMVFGVEAALPWARWLPKSGDSNPSPGNLPVQAGASTPGVVEV